MTHKEKSSFFSIVFSSGVLLGIFATLVFEWIIRFFVFGNAGTIKERIYGVIALIVFLLIIFIGRFFASNFFLGSKKKKLKDLENELPKSS